MILTKYDNVCENSYFKMYKKLKRQDNLKINKMCLQIDYLNGMTLCDIKMK